MSITISSRTRFTHELAQEYTTSFVEGLDIGSKALRSFAETFGLDGLILDEIGYPQWTQEQHDALHPRIPTIDEYEDTIREQGSQQAYVALYEGWTEGVISEIRKAGVKL